VSRSADRRAKWISENGPCANCGSWDSLEVDHVDPESKSFNISRCWTLGGTKLQAELSKCQVLCHECHLLKTRKERTVVPPHGNRRRYKPPYRCRCGLCKLSQSDYASIRYKERKRLRLEDI
jgi:hypothetical protein